MGMSMTHEQSVAEKKLFDAERLQPGYDKSTPGTYFFDGGFGHGKDYGIAPHINMCIPIMVMIGNGYARRVGYAKISPDGKVAMPSKVRQSLKLDGGVL